jgi:hypothetical protein
MKIRNGFVSNSSSSSFVIVTTVANHEKALSNLGPSVKFIMDQVPFAKKKFHIINGRKPRCFSMGKNAVPFN